MDKAIQFVVENYGWLAPLLYEIAVRLFPSEKNLSLINVVKQVVDKTIPNIKKDKDTGDWTTHK